MGFVCSYEKKQKIDDILIFDYFVGKNFIFIKCYTKDSCSNKGKMMNLKMENNKESNKVLELIKKECNKFELCSYNLEEYYQYYDKSKLTNIEYFKDKKEIINSDCKDCNYKDIEQHYDSLFLISKICIDNNDFILL